MPLRGPARALAGGATLAFGQFALAAARTPLTRAIFGLLYGVPAAIAGYQVSFALVGIGTVGSVWQTAFAVVGAVVSGCTAFSRLALLAPSPGWRGTGNAYSPSDARLHDQGR